MYFQAKLEVRNPITNVLADGEPSEFDLEACVSFHLEASFPGVEERGAIIKGSSSRKNRDYINDSKGPVLVFLHRQRKQDTKQTTNCLRSQWQIRQSRKSQEGLMGQQMCGPIYSPTHTLLMYTFVQRA